MFIIHRLEEYDDGDGYVDTLTNVCIGPFTTEEEARKYSKEHPWDHEEVIIPLQLIGTEVDGYVRLAVQVVQSAPLKPPDDMGQ